MYLNKKTYIGNKYKKPDQLVKVIIPKNQEDVSLPLKTNKIKDERIKEIVEGVGYWRKSNAIHAWFVNNVQNGNDDCGDYYVCEEKLKVLLDLVNKVLAKHSLAKKLLPTQSGFFFGGTKYDKYYFEDLKETKKILESALKEGGNFYYTSSW